LTPADDKPVTLRTIVSELSRTKPLNAFAVVLADPTGRRAANPIKIICETEQTERPLEKIYGVLKKAAKQLDPEIPGLIGCFLPGISDFSGLEKDGGLIQISRALFSKSKNNHVAAVTFSSEQRVWPTDVGGVSSFPAVVFRNELCKFDTEMDNFISLERGH
jgi:hypothetical protein